MTGNLPREAITFGVDDLFYASSLRVVRAADISRSGSSRTSGGKIHMFTFSVQWCVGALTPPPCKVIMCPGKDLSSGLLTGGKQT